MAKRFTVEYKKALCTDFLSGGLTRLLFCKSKGIGLSTLYRWLNKYNNTANTQGKFKPINVKHTNELNFLPSKTLQMILPNGIKINLPSQFCSSDLNSLLSVLVATHA